MTLGIVADLDDNSNNNIPANSAAKPSSSLFKDTDCLVSPIKDKAADLAAAIDRKLMHREQFKKLEMRDSYSQALLCAGPDEAATGAANSVKLREEQQAALKRMYEIDTYMTKSARKLRSQHKRQLLREQSFMKSNLCKEMHQQQLAVKQAY